MAKAKTKTRKAPWVRIRKTKGGYTAYGVDKKGTKVVQRTKSKAEAERFRKRVEGGAVARGAAVKSVKKVSGKVKKNPAKRKPKARAVPWAKVRKTKAGYTAYGADKTGARVTLRTKTKKKAEEFRAAIMAGAKAGGKAKPLGKVTRVKRRRNPKEKLHPVREQGGWAIIGQYKVVKSGPATSRVMFRRGEKGRFTKVGLLERVVTNFRVFDKDNHLIADKYPDIHLAAQVAVDHYLGRHGRGQYQVNPALSPSQRKEVRGIAKREAQALMLKGNKGRKAKPLGKVTRVKRRRNTSGWVEHLGPSWASDYERVSGNVEAYITKYAGQYEWVASTIDGPYKRRKGTRTTLALAKKAADQAIATLNKAKPKRKPNKTKKNVKKAAPSATAMASVVKAFKALQARADKRGHGVLYNTKLVVRADVKDSPRHFAYTRGKIIYVAPELAKQSAPVIKGVLAHEFGHVWRNMAAKKQKMSYDAEERAADTAAEKLFGFKIYYDKRGVETTKGGKRPRPAGLR